MLCVFQVKSFGYFKSGYSIKSPHKTQKITQEIKGLSKDHLRVEWRSTMAAVLVVKNAAKVYIYFYDFKKCDLA